MAKVFFNQDSSCFAICTDKGFAVYNTQTLKERFHRDIGGPPDIIDLLYRTNLLAIVGGPRFPPNKVQIWDDAKNEVLTQLEFKDTVRSVKIRRDRICVATNNHIYVYNFTHLEALTDFQTYDNPTGVMTISPDSDFIIACPGNEMGSLRLELFNQASGRQLKTHFIAAHQGVLHRLAMNTSGKLIATCSEKGTIVRVFDIDKGILLHELRRGLEKVDITGMCFNSSGKLLAIVSSKGTVHIYDLEGPASTGYIISGEYSNAKFYLPAGNYKCVFAPKEQLAPEYLTLIGEDYSLHSLVYDGTTLHKTMDPYLLKVI